MSAEVKPSPGSEMSMLISVIAMAITRSVGLDWDGEAMNGTQLADATTLVANALMVLSRASQIPPNQVHANLVAGLESIYRQPLVGCQQIVAQAMEMAMPAVKAAADFVKRGAGEPAKE